MAKIFLAVPQYKKLHDFEIERIKKELQMDWYEPVFKKGFHPMFDQSVGDLVNAGNHKIRICINTGDGNLPRARASSLGIWRYEYDTKDRCDYMMIVDDDLSFPPEAIDILVNDDKPIVGGVYTFKTQNPQYTGKACSRFYKNQIAYSDRPFEIRWLNGGFILVKAEVLLAMIEKYGDLEYDIPEEHQVSAKKTWSLWQPRVYECDGQRIFLGEDWAFCQRARETGFDIWADLRVRLIHWNAEYGYTISIEDEENTIPGWMTAEELDWLTSRSKEMGSVAEIGSWKGRSTFALLSACKGPVYAIDHFQGDPNSERQKVVGDEVYEAFMANVGHFPNLKVMRMSSLEAAKAMDGDRIDMVFVDGNHEAAKEDIEAWLPKTRRLICGHDYNRECVRRAVTEQIGEVETFQSIWFKELT